MDMVNVSTEQMPLKSVTLKMHLKNTCQQILDLNAIKCTLLCYLYSDQVQLAMFLTHLYHSTNDKSLRFDFNDCVEAHDGSWHKQRIGWQSAKMEWWEQAPGRLGNCEEGKMPGRLLSKRTPPPQSSATSPKVCLFQFCQQWGKGWRRKRERLLYWAPLVHCERSLFFLLTCDLYCCGVSRSGGQAAGGTAGGLTDSWANLRSKREKGVRAWEREGKGNQCAGGKRRRGKRREGQERWLRSLLLIQEFVLLALVCQPWHKNDT